MDGREVGDQVKLVVISDLHYRKHANDEVRPAAASRGGGGFDPVAAFAEMLEKDNVKADYLICPGDITDRASRDGLKSGWEKLNQIKNIVGARHLIVATGNHEVCSRVMDDAHDRAGNAEASVDPLGMLQEIPQYPSSIWNGQDRKWVYWGRGYEFISDGDILFLLINSSHFHPTMKVNEFERGRISDHALKSLASDMKEHLKKVKPKVCIAILHHPPVNHEAQNHELGRIEMFNGGRLVDTFDKSGRPWLILHGHKHDGRVVMAQGAGNHPIVFAAGSIGADLQGHQASLHTKLQGYVLTIEVPENTLPSLRGTIDAYAWIENSWSHATSTKHGIPHGCGFASPPINVNAAAESLKDAANKKGVEYLNLTEIYEEVPEFKYMMPGQVEVFRSAVEHLGGRFTWIEQSSYPADVTFEVRA